MVDNHIAVDAASLHAAAKDVRGVRGEIHGELGKLRGAVEELSGAWAGDASNSFQSLMQRWHQDGQKLLDALDGIADILDKSGTSHAATDQAQHDMMAKFTQALNS